MIRRAPIRLAAVLVALLIALGLAPAPGAQALEGRRYVTYNVNFERGAAAVQSDIADLMVNSDVLFLQEAKNVNLKDMFAHRGDWIVVQATGSADTRGTAIIMKRAVVASYESSLVQAIDVEDPKGSNLNDRYVVWVRATFTNGHTVWLAAAHLPPARNPRYQNEYAAALRSQIDQRPGALILGADFNETGDPFGLGAATGTAPRLVGIDGFLVRAQGLNTNGLAAKQMGGSDHRPVELGVVYG